jgi:hypothetical protein
MVSRMQTGTGNGWRDTNWTSMFLRNDGNSTKPHGVTSSNISLCCLTPSFLSSSHASPPPPNLFHLTLSSSNMAARRLTSSPSRTVTMLPLAHMWGATALTAASLLDHEADSVHSVASHNSRHIMHPTPTNRLRGQWVSQQPYLPAKLQNTTQLQQQHGARRFWLEFVNLLT